LRVNIERVEQINQTIGAYAPGRHGVHVVEMSVDLAVGRVDVDEALVAGNGFLFAPVVVSLADFLCACGVSENLPEGATGFTTMEIKANFIGTARAGETIEGRATPVHKGRTTQVWDCVVTNLANVKTIALFRCTQMLLYPRD
jgi:1,4-dihydroxy-2-naphthoyl-CoA hydrolase